MGENLVLNMESRGFRVSVFNRTTAVTEKFASGRAKDKNIVPTKTLEEFTRSLARPRKAQIMVKAGAPVDAVIDQLVPLLEPEDIIIDGETHFGAIRSGEKKLSKRSASTSSVSE